MSVIGDRASSRPSSSAAARVVAAARSRTRPRTPSTGSRRRAPRTPPGPARDERAGRRPPLRQPVAAQLRGRHGVLPARLVHDEVQPEAQRMGRPSAAASRTSTRWHPTRSPRGRSSCCGSSSARCAEISGMRAVTLQPAAGAQGELTGILMIRAYHRARGDAERDEVLVPDSATARTRPPRRWPATGRSPSRSAPDGGVDLDAFRAALGPRTGRRDDHQPVDPRPVRGADRRAARRGPRRPARSPTWTAPT